MKKITAKKHPSKLEPIDAPYMLRAVRARAGSERLRIELQGGIDVGIPLSSLGKPWATASADQVAGVRLRMGGSTLWWDDLGEGLVLDEFLARALRLNPAALLARRGRGRRASSVKAAAARANGAKGGRPRKRRKART